MTASRQTEWEHTLAWIAQHTGPAHTVRWGFEGTGRLRCRCGRTTMTPLTGLTRRGWWERGAGAVILVFLSWATGAVFMWLATSLPGWSPRAMPATVAMPACPEEGNMMWPANNLQRIETPATETLLSSPPSTAPLIPDPCEGDLG